jgi:hypothetical protein
MERQFTTKTESARLVSIFVSEERAVEPDFRNPGECAGNDIFDARLSSAGHRDGVPPSQPSPAVNHRTSISGIVVVSFGLLGSVDHRLCPRWGKGVRILAHFGKFVAKDVLRRQGRRLR